jgi:hypothetical protein
VSAVFPHEHANPVKNDFPCMKPFVSLPMHETFCFPLLYLPTTLIHSLRTLSFLHFVGRGTCRQKESPRDSERDLGVVPYLLLELKTNVQLRDLSVLPLTERERYCV